jgi:hypothetical protein
MAPGYVCVAGVCPEAGTHVRPCLPFSVRCRRDVLATCGGPFGIGAVVEIGATQSSGTPPAIEDHVIDLAKVKCVGNMSANDFWSLLLANAKAGLTDLFGPDLEQQNGGAAVDTGKGSASLGLLIPSTPPIPTVDSYDKIRVPLHDDVMQLNPSLTDLRFWRDDHKTPKTEAVESVASRVESGVDVLVAVGLGREWKRPGDSRQRHWLQVNGIHLADDPLWQP